MKFFLFLVEFNNSNWDYHHSTLNQHGNQWQMAIMGYWDIYKSHQMEKCLGFLVYGVVDECLVCGCADSNACSVV